MSNPIRLNCRSPRHIPSIDDLRELATPQRHVVLQFPTSLNKTLKNALITHLQNKLADWHVFDSGGSNTSEWITVRKVVDRGQVIAHADAIVDAARTFRATATSLCRQLAEKNRIEPSDLIEHRDRGGKLPGGWKYDFHGVECRFQNKKSKQVLEVIIAFGDEFGVLDPYFFGLFIRSTPEFKHLEHILPDTYHDTGRAMKILEELGYLTRIEHTAIYPKSGVVAY